MPKKTMPRNCLTCKYAHASDKDGLEDRTCYIRCGFPVPKVVPPTWSYTDAYISYYRYDAGDREIPSIEVIHAEYHNEIIVEDCPCYRRGKNDLDWHRVPTEDEEA